MSLTSSKTVRYYRTEHIDGTPWTETPLDADEIVEALIHEAERVGGARLFLRRCYKNGNVQRGARLWYFELHLDSTRGDGVTDCYWCKWPYTNVAPCDYCTGEKLEAYISAYMEVCKGLQRYRPTPRKRADR